MAKKEVSTPPRDRARVLEMNRQAKMADPHTAMYAATRGCSINGWKATPGKAYRKGRLSGFVAIATSAT